MQNIGLKGLSPMFWEEEAPLELDNALQVTNPFKCKENGKELLMGSLDGLGSFGAGGLAVYNNLALDKNSAVSKFMRSQKPVYYTGKRE